MAISSTICSLTLVMIIIASLRNTEQSPSSHGSWWRWWTSGGPAHCLAAAGCCSAAGCWREGSGRRRTPGRTPRWRWTQPLPICCRAERRFPRKTTTGPQTRRKCWTSGLWAEGTVNVGSKDNRLLTLMASACDFHFNADTMWLTW